MSTQRIFDIPCPHCQQLNEALVAISINAGRSPHFREALLAQHLHRFHCEHCHTPYNVEVDLNWIDFDRMHWFRVFPLQERSNWEQLIYQSSDTYQRNILDENVPGLVKDLGKGMLVRSVFGMLALREKIIALEAGLDDRVLAMCQWMLFLERSQQRELSMPRLFSCDGHTMEFISEDGNWKWEKPLHFYQVAKQHFEQNTWFNDLLAGPWVDPLCLFYQSKISTATVTHR